MPESLRSYLCQFTPMALGLLYVNVALFVLLAFSFPYLERGTGSYVVAILSLAIVSGSSLCFGLLLVSCRRTGNDECQEERGYSEGVGFVGNDSESDDDCRSG